MVSRPYHRSGSEELFDKLSRRRARLDPITPPITPRIPSTSAGTGTTLPARCSELESLEDRHIVSKTGVAKPRGRFRRVETPEAANCLDEPILGQRSVSEESLMRSATAEGLSTPKSRCEEWGCNFGDPGTAYEVHSRVSVDREGEHLDSKAVDYNAHDLQNGVGQRSASKESVTCSTSAGGQRSVSEESLMRSTTAEGSGSSLDNMSSPMLENEGSMSSLENIISPRIDNEGSGSLLENQISPMPDNDGEPVLESPTVSHNVVTGDPVLEKPTVPQNVVTGVGDAFLRSGDMVNIGKTKHGPMVSLNGSIVIYFRTMSRHGETVLDPVLAELLFIRRWKRVDLRLQPSNYPHVRATGELPACFSPDGLVQRPQLLKKVRHWTGCGYSSTANSTLARADLTKGCAEPGNDVAWRCFIEQRVGVPLQVLLWCDDDVYANHTRPALLGAAPSGFGWYLTWSLRYTCRQKLRSYTSVDDNAGLHTVLAELDENLAVLEQRLGNAKTFGDEVQKFTCLDACAYGHLSVLYSIRCKRGSALHSLLLRHRNLADFCALVERGLGAWPDPRTFLAALSPSRRSFCSL